MKLLVAGGIESENEIRNVGLAPKNTCSHGPYLIALHPTLIFIFGVDPNYRESQYDPDIDVALYNYQQQQQTAIPRYYASYHDHYPISSSNNSAATTIVNLTSQTSSNALTDNSIPSDGLATNNTPLSSLSASEQIPTNNTSSSTPPISGSNPTPPPLTSHGSTSTSSGFTPLFSIISSSILKNSKPKPAPAAPQSQSQLGVAPQINVSQHYNRHQKTKSTASLRSRLVGKGSPSSLQLNSRTNQQSQYPTMATSPGLSPGGNWGDSCLAPSPLYPNMDPAFMKERQMNNSLSAEEKMANDKQLARMGSMNFSTNRQDDGRLQLEQEREFQKTRKLCMWTKSKVVLFLANTLLFLYSVGWTVVMTMSWKGAAWTKPYLDSGIMIVANHNLLYIMMVAAPFGVFISVMGYVGIFAQNRRILSIYAILLWPLFALITSIGYICFRRKNAFLYQKLKSSWINEYTRDDRLVIQNALSCCGYRSPGDYPSYDLYCFPRAPLPSCENLFLTYQEDLLSNTSSSAFSIMVLQLLVMIVALLCSNHIDNLYRTANPITPKLYTQ
ncbi:hypothetical protein BGX26_006572 [Mortierella sp. AD094]|nr:hypothetical protein BGX26_006572 [Mortierella sp. AD094]